MSRKKIIRNYDDEGNLISKECSCCHEVKPVSEFNKCKRNNDRLQLKCKRCSKEYSKEYYKDNAESLKEYSKEYYKDNTEKIKQYYKDNAEKIKEKKKEYRKQYYKDNAEVIKDKQKQYYQNNAEKVKKYNREYGKKYKQDNKEKIKEYDKQYRQDNTERIREYKKQYRNKQIEETLQQIKIEVESDPDKYNYIEGKEIYGVIYLVCNIKSDRYYVGQTTVGFDNRYPKGWLYEHNKKDTVKHDMELYGEDSFEYIKLFKIAHSQYELDKLEAYYIDYYNSYENGYNENRGNIFTDRGKEK